MQNYLIAIIALFLLSSCGEEDPTKKFIGKWNLTGDPSRGIVIQEGGKGFDFGPHRSKTFTWSQIETTEGTKFDVNKGKGFHSEAIGFWIMSLKFEGAYLKDEEDWMSFERAK